MLISLKAEKVFQSIHGEVTFVRPRKTPGVWLAHIISERDSFNTTKMAELERSKDEAAEWAVTRVTIIADRNNGVYVPPTGATSACIRNIIASGGTEAHLIKMAQIAADVIK